MFHFTRYHHTTLSIQSLVLRSHLGNHFHWTQSASRNATWISVTQGESFTSVVCGDSLGLSSSQMV